MKVYLVGGAVRDRLLGLPVRERDWVVVGAVPADLERAGYRSVGREFPVFLHPESHEEYALARLERKVAPGYRGFVTQFSPDVTLEEDLRRRDLTVNAIAEGADGTIVDPYGGRADLAARVLRHVSDAFVEDPVRILRVARFAARFAPLGFTVAPETLALMQRMVRDGEVAALVPERVWQETERALGEPQPQVYFEVLRACGALAAIFPEIEALYGVPQPPRWHPEIDTGVHTLLALGAAADLSPAVTVRFAALVHDLGKARTPRARWPSHPGHEDAGVEPIEALCARLKVPNAHRELALLAAREHTRVHRALELRPETVLELLERCDALRRPERFAGLLLACEADARGRTGLEREPYPQAAYLREAHAAFAAASLTADERAGLAGEAIGRALRTRRLAALTAMRQPPGAGAVAQRPKGPDDAHASLEDFAVRYTAAWCRHRADDVAAYYAPAGSLAINDAPPAVGRAAIAAAAQGFMTAFPDLVVIFDRLEPRGGRVLYHWTLTGTHTGPGGSGNRVRISGYEDWKIGDDGLIADSRGHFDAADWERQVQGR